MTRFACSHCPACVRPSCCRCGRRRLGRLHHRRFERSGAAAGVWSMLERWLTACWWAFARRNSSHPTQLSRPLGGLMAIASREPRFDVSRPQTEILPLPELGAPQNSISLRELTRGEIHAQLPRRVSTEKQGYPRFSEPAWVKVDPPPTPLPPRQKPPLPPAQRPPGPLVGFGRGVREGIRTPVGTSASSRQPEQISTARAVSDADSRVRARSSQLSIRTPESLPHGARSGGCSRAERPSLDTRSLNLTGRVGEKA